MPGLPILASQDSTESLPLGGRIKVSGASRVAGFAIARRIDVDEDMD